MDLYQACEKMTAKIILGEACEMHLEQFIINLNDGETPAMSLVMAMDLSDHCGVSSQVTPNPDEWADQPE